MRAFSVVKVTYSRQIAGQKYLNGRPLFQEAAIGVVSHATFFASSPETASEIVSHWNRDGWKYAVTGMATVREREVPRNVPVKLNRHGDSYIPNP